MGQGVIGDGLAGIGLGRGGGVTGGVPPRFARALSLCNGWRYLDRPKVTRRPKKRPRARRPSLERRQGRARHARHVVAVEPLLRIAQKETKQSDAVVKLGPSELGRQSRVRHVGKDWGGGIWGKTEENVRITGCIRS